jgi:DNA-binding MarR family transcriptional regulator
VSAAAAAPIAARLVAESLIGDKVAELTLRQIAVLDLAVNGGAGRTVKAIAGTLRVSKPPVTRAADRLQSLGFITRRPLDDRRMVSIEATPAGKKHFAAVARALGAAS